MKDLLKWGLIGGGAYLLLTNLSSDAPAAGSPDPSSPQPDTGQGADQDGHQNVNDSGVANGNGTSNAGGGGSTNTPSWAGDRRLNFWGWNHVRGTALNLPEAGWPDPLALPHFAGKTIQQIEAETMTGPQYLALLGLTGLPGLRGLGCAGCGGTCGGGCYA